MADILIRGMEMPQWCSACACNSMHYCQVLKRDVSDFLMTNKFPEDCPLAPLPKGHGRLIDADSLMQSLGDLPYKGSVRRVLMSAPTIVPAEGGTDECSEN